MERLPLEFDSFFSEEQPAPDGEGLFRCACEVCTARLYDHDGKVFSVSSCMVVVIVPGDVCDSCINRCYGGHRDITR